MTGVQTCALPIWRLDESDDVWCLTVPDAEEFSLENGAIVHNCADAMRYLAMTIDRQTIDTVGIGRAINYQNYGYA